MEYIQIYNNNPTVGQTDGSPVSQNNVQTNAVGGLVNLTDTDGIAEKLAIRCAAGYESDGDITISVQSVSNGSYVNGNSTLRLSKTNAVGSTWSDSITFSSVDATNSIFYLKRFPASSIGTVVGALRVQGTIQEV